MSSNIRIGKDGTWWHDGQEVKHERTKELFSKSVLYQNGKYFLTGEKSPVPIEVEDSAFFVKSIKSAGGTVALQLSNHTEEELDFATLDQPQNNELKCRLKSGAPAKFLSKAYYELMRGLQEQDGYLGLWQNGLFYPLQRVQAPVKAKAQPAAKRAGKTPSKKALSQAKKPKKVAGKQSKKTAPAKAKKAKPARKK